MNPAELAIKNRLISVIVIVLALFGGWQAYQTMPRFEDPEFIIRTAQIITQYPGASPREVAEEVGEAIETAVQDMPEVEEIRAVSRAGVSEISVDILYEVSTSKSDLQLIWTKLRNRVADAQGDLPPGAGPSIVFDDFGDVYGLYYLLTGDGFSADELLDYADTLRTDLLRVDGVGKVAFGGVQDEAIFIEVPRERAAVYGASLNALFDALATQNAVAPAGSVRLDRQRFDIAPSGDLDSIEAIESLLVSTSANGGAVYLRDIATVTRGFRDPPSMLIRYNGEPAIAIGVSNVSGANVVAIGDEIDRMLAATLSKRPLGMELNEFYHQGKAVEVAVQDFAVNVGLALVIVVGVLLIFMGPRSGLVIGAVLLLTIAATLATMSVVGIPMHRISLGALIIALGMLVDNAIVVTEGILVGVQKGRKTLDVAKQVVAQTKWPLLGGTLVGAVAFAPVGFAAGATAEYTNHLFWVILISLLFSWLFALTLTPLFCSWLFKPSGDANAGERPDGIFTRVFKALTRATLLLRWPVVAVAVGMFVAAGWGFQFVKGGFFPSSTTPQIVIDYWLPEDADITATDADLRALEAHVAGLDGVTEVQTLVGGGALRYMLVYQFESRNPAYGQIIARVDDYRRIDTLLPALQAHVDAAFPEAQVKVWRFVLGPGGGSKLEAAFQGPDPAVLRDLANQAKAILAEDGGAIAIKDDWRQASSVLQPIYQESAGRQLGVTREDLANALQVNFSGRTVGLYRDGDELIPIVHRAPAAERVGVASLYDVQVISSATGRSVPAAQVMERLGTDWRDAQVRREDRVWTIKAQADPLPGALVDDLLTRVRPAIEAIPLPDGYILRWDGEFGDSAEANESLAATLPAGIGVMVLIVVILFNAVRTPLVIWLTVPLSIIGVVIGLLVMDTPLEFVAILGVLSLSGLLIKNAIVLVDQINLEIGEGKPRYDAIVDSAASRVRPVMMGSITTVLGVAPLLGDAFFRSMAVVLIFGLSFATLLTLIVVPVLYAIAFNIGRAETAR